MKKLVLNKKGMILYDILLVITTAIAIYPNHNITITLITKGIALVLSVICLLISKYMIKKIIKNYYKCIDKE